MKFESLYDLFEAIPDEGAAIAYFKSIRWKDGEYCPYCGHDRLYGFKDGKTWKCAECRERFSIRVGTIFEDSKIPLRKWLAAIWLITSHRKGIASTQLARDLKLTQKSAWFVLHRLRHAARTHSFNRPLRGVVEIDETYVGGKSINRHGRRSGTGGGHSGKTPVVGAVQRKGDVVARVLPVASQPELQGFIHDVVSPGAELLVTDAHPAYSSLIGFPQHQIVNHNRGEYRRGNAHTNSIESMWALLKRQIFGIHHWVSPKHLARYVDELTWRYNRREMPDGIRVGDFLNYVNGRLTYKALIS